MEEKDLSLEKRIEELAPLRRLRCIDAHKLAEEFNAEPKIIGEIANKLKVKIVECQLGCF